MKTTGIAIIGCGRIAEHHCRAIKNNSNLKLVAVSDLIKTKAENLGSNFGVPYYTNYRSMLEMHKDIEVVAIITPSGMHYEHAKEILEIYNKNIIIEKPTVLKPSELINLNSIATQRNLKIFPVFQNRFNKAVQRVKNGIENDELGEIVSISVRVLWCRPQKYYDLSEWRGTYAMDGGCLTNQGIHHLDLMRYLNGNVTKVCSIMQTKGAKIEVEDLVSATMLFDNNTVGTLEITTAARPKDFEASITVVGSKGLAQIGGIAVNELQIYTPADADCIKYSEDFSDCVYGNGHEYMYNEISNIFLGIITDFIITHIDNLNSIKLLNSLYLSDEKKSWVNVFESEESVRLGKVDIELKKLYKI